MKCIHDGCNKAPNYNIKGGKRLYCIKHKSPDMIDVAHSSCEYEDCSVRANYGLKDGKVVLPSALVSVLYMYYDEWSSLAEEEWKTL